ncbi:Glutamine--tRNA ligase (Gln-tRNA) [Candidatus Vidania fulgoroideae]|nr:Glutamine--tRNA ligase (Gln-tRNA) [Candidatus Vidania fulgoroideae]
MIENFFLKKILEEKKIRTRFCPEPSGFLHIGHLKNFYVNYTIAKKTKGKINIRIDDSNPERTKKRFEKNIPIEIFKLGFKKKIKITKTSFYFKRMFKIAKKFIKSKLAYIDSQNRKHFLKNKGEYKKKGINSCFRKRTILENLYIFKKMKSGLFNPGENIARLRINMKSKNTCMRDPVIYRIKKKKGITNMYPNYDFCNSICDRIERINFSVCSKEFENNRELYYFIVEKYNNFYKKKHICKQIELSRLKIEGKDLQKRKIKELIKKKKIINWGDVRLLTLRGMRNRGYSNEVIKDIIKVTGFTKSNYNIKKKQVKKIIIKRMSREIKRKIVAIFKPIRIKDIKNEKNGFFVEKKKRVSFIYNIGKLSFFFLKKKESLILCVSFSKKNGVKKEYFLKENGKNKLLKLYIIKRDKIYVKSGIFCDKNFKNEEILQINKIGFFKTIIKDKKISFFEVESF